MVTVLPVTAATYCCSEIDLIPSTNGLSGNTNVGNVLSNNGSGQITLMCTPLTIVNLVTITQKLRLAQVLLVFSTNA
jgi:hypothetical protein